MFSNEFPRTWPKVNQSVFEKFVAGRTRKGDVVVLKKKKSTTTIRHFGSNLKVLIGIVAPPPQPRFSDPLVRRRFENFLFQKSNLATGTAVFRRRKGINTKRTLATPDPEGSFLVP